MVDAAAGLTRLAQTQPAQTPAPVAYAGASRRRADRKRRNPDRHSDRHPQQEFNSAQAAGRHFPERRAADLGQFHARYHLQRRHQLQSHRQCADHGRQFRLRGRRQAKRRAVRYHQGHGGLRCRRRCQDRRYENIDAVGDAGNSRHDRPCRGAGRRLGDKREQCRDQAVSRRGRQGRDGSRSMAATARGSVFSPSGASGFTIRPGAGGRFAAVPLQISPQQALRDQGIVRQVHAVQSVGRQIVTEKRNQRLQNPRGNNPAANPPRQPGLQKQNGLPQRPGLQKPPGSPQQPGSKQQPGKPQQPAPPTRPGQQQLQQPQLQQPPSLAAAAKCARVARPGLQNRPALQKPKPVTPAPKGKQPKEKKKG